VANSYILSLGVCLLLVGRLSDIFGRRWFFVGGSILALIGNIIGATAQNVNSLIGAYVLMGVAAGTQVSFFWVVSELVPTKYRFIANSGIYFVTIPFTGLGAKVSTSFESQTEVAWRGIFYLLIAMNGTISLLWFFFYHPPSFVQLHTRRSRWQVIRDFDIFGMLLLTGSFLVFLLGLSWVSQV
jgi:MFS family permease